MTFWILITHAPLVLCSVIALTVILERAAFYARHKGLSGQDLSRFEHTPTRQDALSELVRLKNRHGLVGRAAGTLLQHSDDPRALRDEVTALQLQRGAMLFRKRLSAIATIAGLAPILGLLGTIVGLMRAFRDIGDTAGPVEPALVADGLWIALSTTATGLVIATVCLIAHAVYTSLVRRRVSDAEYVMNQASMALEAGKRMPAAA